MKKIKLGVIGLGNMGSKHSQNIIQGLCPEVELAAICDLKQERIDALLKYYEENAEKAAFPAPKAYIDASEMLRSGSASA